MIKKRRRRISDFRPNILARVGVAWFTPQDHARLIEVMVQPHDISRNFERWRETTENMKRYWKRRGLLVVEVKIDPDEFLAWVKASALVPNGKALERFTSERTFG